MKKYVTGGLVLALAAAGACAQSNVAIYGLLDSALVATRGAPEGAETKLESGVSNGSRIGFRGTEDLGDGLSAIFLLEAGIELDTGASDQDGTLFGRQAYMGLKGRWGTLTAGRQYTPIYHTVTAIDPFNNNYGGAAGQLMSGEKAGTRRPNTVMYASPDMGGLSAQLAYGFGEVPGDLDKSRQLGASLTYKSGPVLLRGGYNRTTNATATDSARNFLIIGEYDFGVLTAGLGYGNNKGQRGIDSRDYIAALTVPLGGAHTLMATLIHKSDRAGTDMGANQVAAAYTYYLSKRTNVYVAYAKLSNTRFTTTKFGNGDRELDIGIKHLF